MTLLDKLYALYGDKPILTLRSASVWDWREWWDEAEAA